MKAFGIEKYGSINEMKYLELEDPVVNNRQILVEVKASSVNPVDWKVRNGQMKLITGKKFPKVLGTDFSGVVKHVGKEITKFKAGDVVYGGVPVWLRGRNGANAEYVVVKENEIALKPSGISFEEAAALPVGAITAFLPLQKLKINATTRMLVNGATGGVGNFAVQLAKAEGANVTAVCSLRNFDFAKQLGADLMIDYKTNNKLFSTESFDIVYDAYGKMNYETIKRILRKNGTYITTLGSPKTIVIGLINSIFGGRKILTTNGTVKAHLLEWLSDLVTNNKIKVYISQVFPFKKTIEAYEAMEKGGVQGKIVIKN
ncbi:MAG: NAD(P)-dependent alcohol dehydrogenase [Bacteroidales bacterium]|nr:NAD(P)-dependent alcohol dehydrogenase [Bacteroidales bacterium]